MKYAMQVNNHATPSSLSHSMSQSQSSNLITAWPSILRPRSTTTSCSVIVISPMWRWNVMSQASICLSKPLTRPNPVSPPSTENGWKTLSGRLTLWHGASIITHWLRDLSDQVSRAPQDPTILHINYNYSSVMRFTESTCDAWTKETCLVYGYTCGVDIF